MIDDHLYTGAVQAMRRFFPAQKNNTCSCLRQQLVFKSRRRHFTRKQAVWCYVALQRFHRVLGYLGDD